jgi:hypothetical protein
MDGGGNAILLLEFFGITGVTLGLAFHQLWKLKQFELKQRAKEDDGASAADEARQPG